MNAARIAPLRGSFHPIIAGSSRVLVLGTIPGERSLEVGEYYANPRNAFWRLMNDILGVPMELPYPNRVTVLCEAGVGLWDVMATAYRRGSLDSEIRDPSPNDFSRVFSKFPSITAVLFNGKKPELFWRRHVGSQPARIALRTMPSSSPANARMGYDEKRRIWSEALFDLWGRQTLGGSA